MNLEGQVEAISSKDRNTRYGVKKAYSAKIGNEWINCGFKVPPFEKGEYVTVDVEKNQYGLQLIEGSEKRGTTSAQHVATNVSHAPRVDFPVPDTDRGITIARQNALTAAVNFLSGTPSTKEDVISVANFFSRWTTGRTEMEAAEELMLEMYPNMNTGMLDE